jgi:hypothetical protein
MADKHPYVSAPGNLVQVITHFRKSFPSTVTAETLKKLGFAPKNESYILNVLRFLGIIDEEGKRTDTATKIFNLHDNGAFSQEFSKLVKKSYNDLFDLHADDSWDLGSDSLITFFRSTDDTTAIVGKRQAATFQLLAAFAGHGDVPVPKVSGNRAVTAVSKTVGDAKTSGTKKTKRAAAIVPATIPAKEQRSFGMTVRIEINLPADGNQDTYDRIFKSIRENLLNE